MWDGGRDGIFSVQSAYQLALSRQQIPPQLAESSTAGDERRKMWRKVWKLLVKPKLKHFLWKCLHNWVATGTAIRRRGLGSDDICHRCGLEAETMEHLFFRCPESMIIWKLAPVSWDGSQCPTVSFEEWWKSLCLATLDATFQRRMELTVYLLLYIWKARCLWQFERTRKEAWEVVQGAVSDWHEYQLAMQAKANRQRCTGNVAIKQSGPSAANHPTTIINVASEVSPQTNRIGVGRVLSTVEKGVWQTKGFVVETEHEPLCCRV